MHAAVHVRLAPAAGRRGLSPRPVRSLPILLLAVAALLSSAACRSAGADVRIEWTIAPDPPVVGPAVLKLRVEDAGGRPVPGARLRVAAHMSHPGMAPVIAPATEREGGVYEAEVRFTMAGNWIVLTTGTLSNGSRVEHRFDLPIAGAPR